MLLRIANYALRFAWNTWRLVSFRPSFEHVQARPLDRLVVLILISVYVLTSEDRQGLLLAYTGVTVWLMSDRRHWRLQWFALMSALLATVTYDLLRKFVNEDLVFWSMTAWIIIQHANNLAEQHRYSKRG